jgi:septum formation protein
MIYLASLSPRRCELLKQIQVPYQQLVVDVDETRRSQETPQDYVTRLALTKARAGLAAVSTVYPVLGADTAVVYANHIFGKPVDEHEAKYMLNQLSGHCHHVMTAVAVVTATQEQVRLNVSTVYFRHLTEADIHTYIATGEPLDKAGSYAIQGRASVFIERIEGSYSGVMGLPLYETATLLANVGVNVF